MTKPKACVGDLGKGRGEDRERGGRLVGLSAGLRGQSSPSWELRGTAVRMSPPPGIWDFTWQRCLTLEFHRKLNQLQSLIKDPRFLIKLSLIKW